MAPSTGTYEFGPDNASLSVRTTKAGLGARLAHDLTLEAKSWSGSLTFDEADHAATSVEVTVAATSLVVVDSSGGVKPLSDGDRKEIVRNINDKILLTTKYPDITFRSTAIRGESGTFTVAGDLTIKGTTRPTNLEVMVGEDDQVVIVRATVVQTQFGIKPSSAMLGALSITDEVQIRRHLNAAGVAINWLNWSYSEPEPNTMNPRQQKRKRATIAWETPQKWGQMEGWTSNGKVLNELEGTGERDGPAEPRRREVNSRGVRQVADTG
jgi:polyisoprenoid-binding protein YceI